MAGALVLDDASVRAALSPDECRQAMIDALISHAEGRGSFPLRSVFAPPRSGGFIGLMPAHLSGEPGAFGVKAVAIMPHRPGHDLDAHQGLVALFSGETGTVTAVLGASAITEIRTAAVTAAATDALARDDATVLAIIGAGVQGRAHLTALASRRPWREIRIASRRPEAAQALAARAGELAGDRASVVAAVASAREAVQGADVVVCATSSAEPVLERAWLADGAHVNAVGASAPTARELDVATVADASLFADSRESLYNEALEFRLAAEQGAIDRDTHLRAELGEVLAGSKPGRTASGELTLFRSLGVGIEDLAAAELAVARARELGLGIEVTL
jgi:ornithine cyclodeaminase/alanine dehydrogenase-like protein (mu-crystallin family)